MHFSDIITQIVPIAHAASSAAAEAGGEASQGVIGTLGISWKLFLAQLVNFSIILFVLWKWVFKPVASKLTERSEKIAVALKDAEDIEKEKTYFMQWKTDEISKVKEEAYNIIVEAKKEAEKVKAQILEQTRLEQNEIVKLAKSEIHQETEESVKVIKQEIAGLVVNATERILHEKLDPAKDKQIIKKALTDTLTHN